MKALGQSQLSFLTHVEEWVGGVPKSKDGVAQPSQPRGRQRATEEVAPEHLRSSEEGHPRFRWVQGWVKKMERIGARGKREGNQFRGSIHANDGTGTKMHEP